NPSTDARDDLTRVYGDAGWNAILAGRAKEAIPHIESALVLNPDTHWNTVNLGHAYCSWATMLRPSSSSTRSRTSGGATKANAPTPTRSGMTSRSLRGSD